MTISIGVEYISALLPSKLQDPFENTLTSIIDGISFKIWTDQFNISRISKHKQMLQIKAIKVCTLD